VFRLGKKEEGAGKTGESRSYTYHGLGEVERERRSEHEHTGEFLLTVDKGKKKISSIVPEGKERKYGGEM